MDGVRGVVMEARNERQVLVPSEILASKVSAPPRTFLMRTEALWFHLRKEKTPSQHLKAKRSCYAVGRRVADRRKDVGPFWGMRNTSGGMEDILERGVVVGG